MYYNNRNTLFYFGSLSAVSAASLSGSCWRTWSSLIDHPRGFGFLMCCIRRGVGAIRSDEREVAGEPGPPK